MKIIISLSLLIAALSLSYYFIIFLPNEQVKQRQLEEWRVQVTEQNNPVRLLDQCLNEANQTFVQRAKQVCLQNPKCGTRGEMQFSQLTASELTVISLLQDQVKKDEDGCYRKYKK